MLNAQRFRKGQFLYTATIGCIPVGFLVLLAGCPGTTPTVDPCADVTCDDGFTCDAATGQCAADAVDPDPDPDPAGDADAGQTFYTANGCVACHGAAAEGGVLLDAPSLVGVGAGEILDHNSGVREHAGGTVDGITPQDADDVAAWLASLQ